jgi:SAM-dependent methyltransferase
LNEWWQDFFKPIVGEVLSALKTDQSEPEVDQVIERVRAKTPLHMLDLACGAGRHSILFAARGLKVTGLDYSKGFLKTAKTAARKARQKIRFVHGDMRNLKAHFAANEFGLVVSLSNNFGYFRTRRDDFKVLQAVHFALRPGGAFVLNTLNGPGLSQRPMSFGYEPLRNVFLIEAPRYDVRNRRTLTNWTIIDARRAKARIFRLSFRQNIYSHDELTKLLTAAGFSIEATWGTLAGGPFRRHKSPQQTILARKRAV